MLQLIVCRHKTRSTMMVPRLRALRMGKRREACCWARSASCTIVPLSVIQHSKKQRKSTALNRQRTTQQQTPEPPAVTPLGVRVRTGCINPTKGKSHKRPPHTHTHTHTHTHPGGICNMPFQEHLTTQGRTGIRQNQLLLLFFLLLLSRLLFKKKKSTGTNTIAFSPV